MPTSRSTPAATTPPIEVTTPESEFERWLPFRVQLRALLEALRASGLECPHEVIERPDFWDTNLGPGEGPHIEYHPETCRDIVLRPHTSREFCARGPKFLYTSRPKSMTGGIRARCKGGGCHICFDYYCDNTLRRIVQYKFDFALTIHRLRLTSYAEYQRVTRRNAYQPYAGGKAWAVFHADGTVSLFTSGPLEDSVEVSTIPALLAALLESPAYPAKSHKRHSGAPKDREREKVEGENWVPTTRDLEHWAIMARTTLQGNTGEEEWATGLPHAAFQQKMDLAVLNATEEDWEKLELLAKGENMYLARAARKEANKTRAEMLAVSL
jgi:hypothetical protein